MMHFCCVTPLLMGKLLHGLPPRARRVLEKRAEAMACIPRCWIWTGTQYSSRCLLAETEEGRTHCLAVPWTGDFVRIILERHDLDTLLSFRAMYWEWVLQCPAAMFTVQGHHDDRPLRTLCRPGAWLLDSVYTEILVIERLRTTTIIYEAVGNVALQHLAELILHPVYSRAVLVRGRNYVGNVMEHLAWLALEEGRDELVVAVAFYLMRFTFQR